MLVIYFDPKPKTRREDLYNREEELREFKLAIESSPLTVVTGIRRLGKTSLILVGLTGRPSVIVDLRGVSQSRAALYKRIEFALNQFFKRYKNLRKKIREKIRAISGVEVLGIGVYLSWGRKRADLAALLKSLEEYGVVLVFDEVQYARGPIGKELAETLAYLYDHSELKIVLSGSEVGLLYDFLGVENPKAPLYGRYFKEIKLKPFTRGESVDFLEKGFGQYNVTVSEEMLGNAVEKLDGIVGWLVYFGLKYIERKGGEGIVGEIVEEAGRLSLVEFMRFTKKHVPADRRILETAKAIARGQNTWTKIKSYLERVEKRSIPDMTLNRTLKTLLKSSYIDRIVEGRNIYYTITDPTLKHALQKLV
ncbi:MAG: ATP-binding protein [Thermoproteales archaeon]|nr:ATP-binding protein [Thermoproteales archaeon]